MHRDIHDTGPGKAGPRPAGLVLALDVGTTNAKAAFYDDRAEPVGAIHRVRMPVRPDGTADPAAAGEAVDDLLDAVLGAPPEVIRAVGITCAWHGLVGVDQGGAPTTDISTWYDTRAAPAAERLWERVEDPADVQHRTGAPLHPALPPARLLRLREADPEGFGRTRRWCSMGEFLLLRWFGPEVPASASMASGSGLFDQIERRWDAELVGLLGLPPETLAPVSERPRPGADLPLRAACASRWPALAGAVWTDAYGDGGAAVVGSGCEDHGRAALTVGTSAAARLLLPAERRPVTRLPRALFSYLLEPDRSVVGIARSNAGNLLGWARRVLRLPDADDPVQAVTGPRPPGGHGLVPVPSFAGERSPDWPFDARGSLGGLRIATTPEDVLQALLEGAILGLGQSLERLDDWAGPQDLVLSGGAAWSTGWTRLLVDGLGRPLLSSSVKEASLRGAAVLAWRLADPGWEGPPPAAEERITPNPERAEVYRRLAIEWGFVG